LLGLISLVEGTFLMVKCFDCTIGPLYLGSKTEV
jgi:ribosomal protein S27E